MPPPLPSAHRGMTANPLKPTRYRPGKPVAEEPSSSEDEDEEESEAAVKAREEEEKRKRAEIQRRQRQQQTAPKASSFPAGKITKGVKDVKIDEKDEDEDEEGFVTDEEEDQGDKAGKPSAAGVDTGAKAAPAQIPKPGEDEDEEEEDEEEEDESSEEESSEDERPRVLLRPTFIKKDKRNVQDTSANTTASTAPPMDDAAAAEAHRAQRKEKADMLIREQLEKTALERSAATRQWDDDEAEANEEAGIDDTDNLDPAAEYAAWKLRELKRVKRSREAIEASEKEREEVERRRNLTAEEREREDAEFISKQKEEKEATRGQPGFMQRYFHKGAFFHDDLQAEGLDQRNVMGRRFVDDVSRETLPEYMQVRDLTQVGKKGRTRYRDLRSEDTGRFGEGLDSRRRRHDGPPIGVTDERFMPDSDRGNAGSGPTGANASVVKDRRRRSRSRSYSPRRERRDHDRGDSYRPDGPRRKRSPSPYEDRDKRRRTEVS